MPQSSASHRLKHYGPGVVLECVLVHHPQRGKEPDLLQTLRVHHRDAGVPIAILGADGLGRTEKLEGGLPVRVAPEIVDQ